MREWKLSRIKINGFKAFKYLQESYDGDLIVYDGPNGFGKTSLFDAKQVLFTGVLPRIAAKVQAVNLRRSRPRQSLFQHFGYAGDVEIIAEFVAGGQNLIMMRKASQSDGNKANRPDNTDYFKLYQLQAFDDLASAVPIVDEAKFWTDNFGENFLKNYTVLHYLPQDHSPLLLPDASVDNQRRTSQIEHLFNLDEINNKLERYGKTLNIAREKQKSFNERKIALEDELNKLKTSEQVGEQAVEYRAILPDEAGLKWDTQVPFDSSELQDLNKAIQKLEQITLLVEQKEEVKKRFKNQRTKGNVKTPEFKLAVLLGSHLDKLDEQKAYQASIQRIQPQLNAATKSLTEMKLADFAQIEQADAERYLLIKERVEEREKLLAQQQIDDKTVNDLIGARDKLRNLIADQQTDCPLCGFEYSEHQALIDAIESRKQALKNQLDELGREINDLNAKIQPVLNEIKQHLEAKLTADQTKFNEPLLNKLEANKDKVEALGKIVEQLKDNNIAIPSEFTADEAVNARQVTEAQDSLLATLEEESEELTEDAYMFFSTYFKKPENLEHLTQQVITDKKRYLNLRFNEFTNQARVQKQEAIDTLTKRITACVNVINDIKQIGDALKQVKNNYVNDTVGQIECLFHIYSGRLLLNYQCGLGVFINMPTKGTQQSSAMHFIAPRLAEHDAVLSMSSGQTSALSLALFLALNKRYADAKFVFIDDPTQCMDEINVASLSDLLRVELRNKQVVISTHEQDVSSYLTYRYEKAGLSAKTINLLQRAQASASEPLAS